MSKFSLRPVFVLVAAAVLTGSLVACNGGGSSASSASSAGGTANSVSLSGNVVDGYVRNAQVAVYSDPGMSTQIGSGTTDSNGNFKIALSVGSPPSTVYLKTEGGTDNDTGMPAPTMYFVGSGSRSSFHVTPFTTAVANYTTTDTLSNAETNVSSDLSLTSSELYDDPETNTTLKTTMEKVLASGTQQTSIPAGSYKMIYFGLDSRAIGQPIANYLGGANLGMADTTVASDGSITGTGPNGNIIYGKVQGNTAMLNVTDSLTNPTSLFRVVGTVGLFGNLSGNTSAIDNLSSSPTAANLQRGAFVATMMPVSGVNTTNLVSAIQNFYQGKQFRILFNQVFGNGEDLGWGTVTFNTIDATTVQTSNIPVGVVAGNGTTMQALSNQLTLQYNATDSGVYSVTTGGNTYPANIMVIHYDVMQSSTNVGGAYLVLGPGSRRGIYVKTDTSGNITGVGNVYLARSDALIPSLQPGKHYDMEIASVGPWSIGQTRTSALQNNEFLLSSQVSGGIDTTGMSSTGGTFTADTAIGGIVFNGSMMGIKNDLNEDDLAEHGNGNGDAEMVVEMFESGAMSGLRQEGGCANLDPTNMSIADCGTASGQLDPSQPGIVRLKNWPTTFVSFAFEQGGSTPTFTGKVKFLARALYARDYGSFKTAYHSGELDIGPSTTTISGSDSSGTYSGTLTTQVSHGMVHMYGPFAGGYFDIYWPIGGNKAIYLVSQSATGNVDEVGECFVTR